GDSLAAVVVADANTARRAIARLKETRHPGAVIALGVQRETPGLPLLGEPVRPHVRSAHAGVEALLDVMLAAAVVVPGGWQEALDVALAYPGAVAVTSEGDRFSAAGSRVGASGPGVTRAALDEARARAADAATALEAAEGRLAAAQVELEAATGNEAEAARALDANDGRRAGSPRSTNGWRVTRRSEPRPSNTESTSTSWPSTRAGWPLSCRTAWPSSRASWRASANGAGSSPRRRAPPLSGSNRCGANGRTRPGASKRCGSGRAAPSWRRPRRACGSRPRWRRCAASRTASPRPPWPAR